MKNSNHIDEILAQTAQMNKLYRPSFFHLYLTEHASRFSKLLSEKKPMLFDRYEEQVKAFIELQDPKVKYTDEELHEAFKGYCGKHHPHEMGLWVYYPWNNKCVHLLEESHFIAVRTNRNRNKITADEQGLLMAQKIGVIGLSVGQSISLTMCMERSFGEIRLADFDLLELTNLNRIRTGTHNLGVSKAVAVAREIAEIDPYLNVTCFTEGLNEDNIDDFFFKGGKLDILVDECDGLDMKIIARLKAKENRIPVVMDMSDRGTIDVERFDLEPNRPILHGWIDHLDPSKIKDLKTNEDKIPFLLPMIGADTISKRLKASMIEVGQSITTWPQLSTAVTLGGALAGDVCRRICLDQFHDSGRYFVDLEELIQDKKSSKTKKEQETFTTKVSHPPLQVADIQKCIENACVPAHREQIIPDNTTLTHLLQTACNAPSAGNNQPWKWVFKSPNLYLFHEKSRSISFADYDDLASMVGLGTAIENIALAAAHQEIGIEPLIMESSCPLIAAFRFFPYQHPQTEQHPHKDLYPKLPLRCTNRNIEPTALIEPKKLVHLSKMAESIHGAKLEFVTDKAKIATIADIIGKVEKVRFLHPRGHYEFFQKELRWTATQAKETQDGIDINTLDLSLSDQTGLKMAAEPEVVSLLREWDGGSAFEKISKKAVETSGAIGYLYMPEHLKESFVKGGRAVQRVWIEANAQGLAFHPVVAPLYLFARLLKGNGEELDAKMQVELQHLYQRFQQLFPQAEKVGNVFLFRLCHGNKPVVKAHRKDYQKSFLEI